LSLLNACFSSHFFSMSSSASSSMSSHGSILPMFVSFLVEVRLRADNKTRAHKVVDLRHVLEVHAKVPDVLQL
jgi:hypothetical protein